MSHLIRSERVAHASHSANTKESVDSDSTSIAHQKIDIMNGDERTDDSYRSNILNETYRNNSTVSNNSDNEVNKQLLKVRSQAYSEGLKEGEEIGYKKGLISGVEQGILQGEKQGKEIGMQLAKELAEEDLLEIDVKKSELAEQVENFKSILNLVEQRLDNEKVLLESVGVEIIYEVLLKILGNRAQDRTLIEDVLKQCLHKCMNNKILKIRISLEDYQYFDKELSNEGFSTFLNKIELVPDLQILPGGCVVETDAGNLDARLESQLESFKKYLLDIFHNEQKISENMA